MLSIKKKRMSVKKMILRRIDVGKGVRAKISIASTENCSTISRVNRSGSLLGGLECDFNRASNIPANPRAEWHEITGSKRTGVWHYAVCNRLRRCAYASATKFIERRCTVRDAMEN